MCILDNIKTEKNATQSGGMFGHRERKILLLVNTLKILALKLTFSVCVLKRLKFER